MLLDQSECGKSGPETEASVFMRATSVVVIDFPQCVWYTLPLWNDTARGNAAAVSFETVNKFELHYVCITVLVSYDQTMYPDCLFQLFQLQSDECLQTFLIKIWSWIQFSNFFIEYITSIFPFVLAKAEKYER